MFKFSITLTWSKILATLIIILAFIIDVVAKNPGTVFMFALPFVTFLIAGKQTIDLLRTRQGKDPINK